MGCSPSWRQLSVPLPSYFSSPTKGWRRWISAPSLTAEGTLCWTSTTDHQHWVLRCWTKCRTSNELQTNKNTPRKVKKTCQFQGQLVLSCIHQYVYVLFCFAPVDLTMNSAASSEYNDKINKPLHFYLFIYFKDSYALCWIWNIKYVALALSSSTRPSGER